MHVILEGVSYEFQFGQLKGLCAEFIGDLSERGLQNLRLANFRGPLKYGIHDRGGEGCSR